MSEWEFVCALVCVYTYVCARVPPSISLLAILCLYSHYLISVLFFFFTLFTPFILLSVALLHTNLHYNSSPSYLS